MTDLQPTDALEGSLRTLLADRAATVTGPPPALPDVVVGPRAVTRVGIGIGMGEEPLRVPAIPARRRPRWGAVAAVAAVAAVVIGVVVIARGQDHRPETLEAMAPPPITGLPRGLDPDTAGRVMRINTDRDPETAARRYLRWRLTEPGATPDEVVDGIEFDAGARAGAIVPVTWKRADGTTGGTVIVRIGEHGSDIVAATTPGVDLADVRMDGSRAVGKVQTTEGAPAGPALVDVLIAGHTLPGVPGGDPGTTEFHGYGAAAKGDRAFSVEVGEYDPIVSVRFIDGDGAVRSIAEVALDAPDTPGPDLSTMTPEEVAAYFDDLPPDPRCTAADAGASAQTAGRPGGGPAQRLESVDRLFDLPPAPSPQAAVVALADALDLDLEEADVTITSPLSSGGVAGTRLGSAPVEVMVWEHDGGFEATEVTTPAACWVSGGGARPSAGGTSQIGFSRIASAQTGELWYQADDGSTWTVPLVARDFAGGSVAIGGQDRAITAFAVVARDADGNVVLVQRSTL